MANFSVWSRSVDSDKKWDRKQETYKPRPAASGRVAIIPERLEQERFGDPGAEKITQEERVRKLREALAKSTSLTEKLLRKMDRDSGGEEEGSEEEGLTLKERMSRRRGKTKKIDKSDSGNDQSESHSESEEDSVLSEGVIEEKLDNDEMPLSKRAKLEGISSEHKSNGARIKPAGKRKKVEHIGDNYDTLQQAVADREFEGIPLPGEQPLLVSGGVMKDYQLAGLKWVANLRELGANGILADEMGLGKTLQTISLLCHVYAVKKRPGPFLVIAPLSTIANWEKEVQRFAPGVPCSLLYPRDKAESLWGKLEERVACPQLGGKRLANIFITSYDTAIGIRSMLEEVNWDYIVVDEGHRIKNRNCRLALVLKTFRSTNRLLLTGTPLQNNMGELWALLNFLQPEIFDDFEVFESWFNAKDLHMNENEKTRILEQEEKSNILASIHKIIGPFMLRRVKSEVEFSIPPKTEVMVYCPFSLAQADQYQYFRGLLIKTKEKVNKEAPMVAGNLGHYMGQYMMDLRCAVNHPYILDDQGTRDQKMVESCGKLQVLDQMLERLISSGHKTLVFSQMTRVLDLLGHYLDWKGISYCHLDGRMPYLERQENVERFSQDPTVMVFLLSTRAGGLGINLTAADTCIIYDSDWNPQQDLQAQARCHRIGQTKPVMIYRLVTRNTIDQVMVERAQAKRVLERLVVHKDKFKSGRESLRKNKKGLDSREIMRLLLSDEVSATCKAGSQQQWGLEEEVLNRLLDRENRENFKEQMEKINILQKEMAAEVVEDNYEDEQAARNKEAAIRSKGFKCNHCENVYPYRNSLDKHKLYSCKTLKLAAGEFECVKCSARFVTEHELTLHKNTHLGLKPYKCDHCDKRFGNPTGLMNHTREFHKDLVDLPAPMKRVINRDRCENPKCGETEYKVVSIHVENTRECREFYVGVYKKSLVEIFDQKRKDRIKASRVQPKGYYKKGPYSDAMREDKFPIRKCLVEIREKILIDSDFPLPMYSPLPADLGCPCIESSCSNSCPCSQASRPCTAACHEGKPWHTVPCLNTELAQRVTAHIGSRELQKTLALADLSPIGSPLQLRKRLAVHHWRLEEGQQDLVEGQQDLVEDQQDLEEGQQELEQQPSKRNKSWHTVTMEAEAPKKNRTVDIETPMEVSEALAKVIGTRVGELLISKEVFKRIWNYLTENNLKEHEHEKSASSSRKLNVFRPDETLHEVFGVDKMKTSSVYKLVKMNHLAVPGQEKPEGWGHTVWEVKKEKKEEVKWKWSKVEKPWKNYIRDHMEGLQENGEGGGREEDGVMERKNRRTTDIQEESVCEQIITEEGRIDIIELE